MVAVEPRQVLRKIATRPLAHLESLDLFHVKMPNQPGCVTAQMLR